jgi:hypothetical protein
VIIQSIRRWKGLQNGIRAAWPTSDVLDYASGEIPHEQGGRELIHDDNRSTTKVKCIEIPSFSFFRRTSSSYTSVESS